MTAFLLYCLGVYFCFYVFNCADIAEPFRNWLFPRLNENVEYALKCALCTTFWVTLWAYLVELVPFGYVGAAPIINLVIDKSLAKLSK